MEQISPLAYENILLKKIEEECTHECLEKIKQYGLYRAKPILEKLLRKYSGSEITKEIKEIISTFDEIEELLLGLNWPQKINNREKAQTKKVFSSFSFLRRV